MNELDILEALTDVDDKYVLEASEGIAGKTVLKRGTKKRTFAAWNSLPAMIAAGVALAVIVAGGIVAVKAVQKKAKGKESEKTGYTAASPFVQGEAQTTPLSKETLEAFSNLPGTLDFNGRTYVGQYTECTKVGGKIGTYKVSDTVEQIVTEEGIEHLELVDIENDVDVYEIPGVKTSYAVAVFYEDLQKYIVFGGIVPDVSNVAELRENMPIDTYFKMDKTYKVMVNGYPATYSNSAVNMEQVVNILLKNAESPVYELKDMPNDFFKDTPFFDEYADRERQLWDSWISRYDSPEDPKEGKDWAQAFCKEHPLGELLLTGYVHNTLIEPANASGLEFYLYSGGYIFGIGGSYGDCIYVGPEAAAEFRALFETPAKSTEPTE
ncbi:MAG: hypothetical protein J5845_08685 [Lachnospiraceae bacterium]|nr:hypothetical protein [Lachnospiraceae bacterium]